MGEIREGQKVKLSLNLVGNPQKEFDCFIKSVYSDRLFLEFPNEILDYSEYFEEGNEIPVKVFTPTGVKIFDALILDSPLEEDFVIEYVDNPTDIQRREFVRIQMTLKVVIERGSKNNVVAHTIDISGGGIKFFYEGDFIPKEIVKLTLYIPQDRSIQAEGIIIPNSHIPANEHVLSFTKIDEKERDRIIKKCFEMQVTTEE